MTYVLSGKSRIQMDMILNLNAWDYSWAINIHYFAERHDECLMINFRLSIRLIMKLALAVITSVIINHI